MMMLIPPLSLLSLRSTPGMDAAAPGATALHQLVVPVVILVLSALLMH